MCHCEEAKGRRGALSAQREEVPLGCNLAVPARITEKLRRIWQCYAAGRRGRRPLQWRVRSAIMPPNPRPARRSGSAATDAIGLYVLSALCTNWKCLPEIATAPLGPRNDKLVNLTPPNSRCKAYGLHGAQGTPLQTQSVHAVFTTACTNCKCSAGRGMPRPYSARLAASRNFPLSILNFPFPAAPTAHGWRPCPMPFSFPGS